MRNKRWAAMGLCLALCCVMMPISIAANEGGVSVTSDSGTETVLGTNVTLTPLPSKGRLKVNDLLHYHYDDFIDLTTGKAAKAKLDPNAGAKSVQLEGSNWYAAPSLTRLLQRLYIYREVPRATMPVPQTNGGDYDVSDEPEEYYEEATEEEEIDAEPEPVEDDGYAAPVTSVPTHSTTNTQVEGVDESDIIKTDGSYLFYLHPNKGIAVFDVRSGTPKQIGMLKPNARIGEELPKYEDLYVSGDNLIIVSRKTNINIYEGISSDQTNLPTSMYQRNYNSYTGVDIYDISNPANIVRKRQVNFQGDAITTRLYNNTLYITSRMWIQGYDDAPLIDILPKYQDSALGESFYLMSPNDIHLSVYSDSRSIQLTALAAIDISSTESPMQLTAYETQSANDLYMSSSAIYLLMGKRQRSTYDVKIDTGMRDNFPVGKNHTNGDTLIARFTTKKGGYSFAGMAKVSGQIKDKFSLNESKSTLRVLSTRYRKEGTAIDLTVFDTKTLKQSGHLSAFATKTSLDSVRFRGDTLYVTTSGTFEPLLVLDLSTPASPKKAGSLDLSGFTGYLHPYKNNYLIGLGYDVENTYVKNKDLKDKHIGYRSGGVKFTMYDVSSPQKPKELHSLVIGSNNSTTIGMANPKTIMFDDNRGTMTMPFYYQDAEIKPGDTQSTVTTWKGGIVIEIAPSGFKEGARFELNDYYANSSDTRFAFVDDTLYYATSDYLVSLNYNTYKIKDALVIAY